MNPNLEKIRSAVGQLKASLPSEEIALINTSRDMQAIVDAKFAKAIEKLRWFAIVSHTNHIYAVTEMEGKRISLQRLVKHLSQPEVPLSEIKQVGFRNKLSFDCRVANLADHIGRQAVMRSRKPKRNSSSDFKGVIKKKRSDDSVFWRSQIKGDLGTMSLGSYDCEKFAARVYDAAAFALFGSEAYFNFQGAIDPKAAEIAKNRIARFNRFKEEKMRVLRGDNSPLKTTPN
jgi:hypothetical protein